MKDINSITDIEEFIKVVAEDCFETLSEKDKDYLRTHPSTSMHHFGYALYIRNRYIHGRELSVGPIIPDSLSSDIMKYLFSLLLPGEYIYGNTFLEEEFEHFDFVQLWCEYKIKYDRTPIDIVNKYRDAYSEAIRPLEEEKQRVLKEKEGEFLVDEEYLDLDAFCDFDDDMTLQEEDSELRMMLAQALARSDFYSNATAETIHKEIEIREAIRERMIAELAEYVWETPHIREKAKAQGVYSVEFETLIDEFKNLLYDEAVFVPLEAVFLKYQDCIEPDEYHRSKERFIRAIGIRPDIAEKMDPAWFNDRDIAKALFANGRGLSRLVQYQDDEEMVTYALGFNGTQIDSVSDRLRCKEEIVELAIANSRIFPIMLLDCMAPYRKDKEKVYKACLVNGNNLYRVDPKFRDDYDLARQMISNNIEPSPYWGMSDRLKDNISLALLDADTHYPNVDLYSERLRDCDELAEKLIEAHGANNKFLNNMSERIKEKYGVAINE